MVASMKEVYSIVCQTNLSPKLFSRQLSKKHNCNPFQSSSSLSIRFSFCIRRVIYTVILFRFFFFTPVIFVALGFVAVPTL